MRVVHHIHCPDIGPICELRDEPGQQHDQTFYVSELRALLEYQLRPWLSAEAQLPFRVSATRITYLRADGTPFVPDYEDIHHRNETLLGPGDPWLSLRLSTPLWADFLGLLRVGLTVPIGRTEENPFALGAAGRSHQHVQFGTGTVNPLLGFELNGALGPVRTALHGNLQASLYENRYGYLAGTRATVGLEGSLRVWGPLQLGLAFDVFHEEPERWDGVIQQDGNLGRTDYLIGLSAAYPLGDYVLTGSVKVPVYQRIITSGPEGGQLSYPAVVGFGLRRAFTLAP